jgi:hypothetical protein
MVGRVKKARRPAGEAKVTKGRKKGWGRRKATTERKLNKDGTERKKRRTSVWPEWYVYMIELESGPNKGCTYIGKTYNYEKRLRQHNCEFDKPDKGIFYGAKATRIKSSGGLHKWRHVWVVGGFTMPGVCETHALSFENRVKHLPMGYNKGEPQTTLAYKFLRTFQKQQKHVHRRTRLMLIACCMSKWGPSTLGVQTVLPPLTVHWFGPDCFPSLPNSSSSDIKASEQSCRYLPARCRQVFHDLEPSDKTDVKQETSKVDGRGDSKEAKQEIKKKPIAATGQGIKKKKAKMTVVSDSESETGYVPRTKENKASSEQVERKETKLDLSDHRDDGYAPAFSTTEMSKQQNQPSQAPKASRKAKLIVLSDDDES